MKVVLRIAIVLMIGCSSLAFAQRQGRQNNRQQQRAAALAESILSQISDQSDPVYIIFRKDVQRDLEMDLGQRGKFDHLYDAHVAALQAAQQQSRRNPTLVSDTISAQKSDTQSKIDGTLTDTQKARLNQVSLQLQGEAAVFHPEVQKALNLTSDQKAQIQGAQNQFNQEIAEVQRSLVAGEITNAMLPDLVKQDQKELNTTVKQVLTPDQIAALAKYEGKPFVPKSN